MRLKTAGFNHDQRQLKRVRRDDSRNGLSNRQPIPVMKIRTSGVIRSRPLGAGWRRVISILAERSGLTVLLFTAALGTETLIGQSAPAPTAPETGEKVTELDPFFVTGKAENLIGLAIAASKGQADSAELHDRPFLRRGELMEVVPGMIITQHSGGGKANQYFLRGFNLDHGTDFGVFVEGMPVNKRTHGHGQGYADVNFIVPELIERIDYFKGGFDPRHGDLSAAGAAEFAFHDVLPGGIATLTVGENNFYRGLVGDSFETTHGAFSLALELSTNDGPWLLPEDFTRVNGFGRYFSGDDANNWSLTLMGYTASWDSTDQVPARLIESGEIDRFGYVDPTVGGSSRRYSASYGLTRAVGSGILEMDGYLGHYHLDLFSNFTYLLDNPIDGDQFNQYDDRVFAGFNLTHSGVELEGLGEESRYDLGFQTHHDLIDGVALHRTRDRQRLDTVREDDVYQMNVSGFASLETRWNDWFRSQIGLRGDVYYFDVSSDNPVNSGSDWAGILSPKVNLVFGPWSKTEFYLNAATGFHSNDARGVTIRSDPVDGSPVDPVDPLVRTLGTEFGIRSNLAEGVTATLALWYLESDSELIYVGDAGNVEAGDATERYGIEAAFYWRANAWLYLDSEITVTESEFKDSGEKVENSVPVSFAGGITAGKATGLFGSFRLRYFSERPLNGDASIESQDAFQANTRLGWRTENWEMALEVLNLFDASDNDIEYLYASRVAGEPLDGIEDIHLHPFEPRQFRVTVSYYW